jgi:hypothetical protein
VESLEQRAGEVLRRVQRMRREHAADYEKVIQNFFDKNGRLKNIPSQRKKKMYVFEHMLQGLEMGRSYTEKEIDAFIKQFHDDHCTIRREFIINHYMHREDGMYTLNPPEQWAKIE